MNDDEVTRLNSTCNYEKWHTFMKNNIKLLFNFFVLFRIQFTAAKEQKKTKHSAKKNCYFGC